MKPAERRLARGFLFTDLYQLTMAQLYFREGLHDAPASFDYFYRRNPDYGGHQAGYTVFAGLAELLDRLEETRVTEADVAALREVRGGSGERLFGSDFLQWLGAHAEPFAPITVNAVAEGRVVHPRAPLATVQGPLASVQLIESALLNTLNYSTLIAAKAARLHLAAGGAPVVDFGMRRGQGEGVNVAARAALVGGVDASSNTGAAIVAGVQPVGTHAHALVQAFIANGGSELDAFRAYARTYPDDCLLLIDTVDTLNSGLPNAITVFEELRRAGREPAGVRLDSGDLAHLSVECAVMLDEAGFESARITLSNQLDELTIWQIRSQIEAEARSRGLDGAAIVRRLSYGVGTNLMVSEGAPALDGVFKLVALESGGEWRPAIKISDTPAKTINPGLKDLYRIYDERGKATADLVTLAGEEPRPGESLRLCHHSNPEIGRTLAEGEVSRVERLLQPVWRDGRRLVEAEPIEVPRSRREADEGDLDAGVMRLINPHVYHVSISERLSALKAELMDGRRTLPGYPAGRQ